MAPIFAGLTLLLMTALGYRRIAAMAHNLLRNYVYEQTLSAAGRRARRGARSAAARRADTRAGARRSRCVRRPAARASQRRCCALLLRGLAGYGDLAAEDFVMLRRLATLLNEAIDHMDLRRALREERDQQQWLAGHDHLTGLPNRNQLAAYLNEARARASVSGSISTRAKSAPRCACANAWPRMRWPTSSPSSRCANASSSAWKPRRACATAAACCRRPNSSLCWASGGAASSASSCLLRGRRYCRSWMPPGRRPRAEFIAAERDLAARVERALRLEAATAIWPTVVTLAKNS